MCTVQTSPESHRFVYRNLAAAARRIPSCRKDKSVHPATMTRWITRGVRLQDGKFLRLAAKRFPGGWGVTDEAVDEFVDALTADRYGVTVPTSSPQESTSRQRVLARVDAELDALGV